MLVKICIGSACHLKGSYDIINYLKEKIAQEHLEDQIILKASFCLGKCSEAVSVQIDDHPVTSVSPETVEHFFNTVIKESLIQ
ncbi:MAG: NAD(P)H-dependent oxidoreductase subunit E [Clostridia bacterium]|nr:NAD(P)H-dependent oxidoreductase subunit E [Clostridia bacterium]